MNHIGKFAVLGAVLAACGTSAFAASIPFTGQITVQDAPAGDTGSSDSSIFILSSVFTGTSMTGTAEPNVPTGSTNLVSYIYNTSGAASPTLFTYSTASIATSGTTGIPIYLGQNNTNTESAEFYATSYGSLQENTNGDYGMTLYGYFTDREANHTPGFDNVTFNSGTLNTTASTTNGSLSEILTATPTAVAPEPSSLLLLGSGMLGGAGLLFRRRRA